MTRPLAPGVFIEEIPNGAKPIEGIATATAGFVGAAHTGPLDVATFITAMVEFERQFGDGSPMQFQGLPPSPSFLWHAARAYFEGGGQRAWVARVHRSGSSPDGARPQAADFERGLTALDTIADLPIIAAPGSTSGSTGALGDDASASASALIAHAERHHDRFAVIDPPKGLSLAQVIAWRAQFKSSFAAFYFPWIQAAGGEFVPPSGAIAGVYANTDITRGVSVAPTDQPIVDAAGVETSIDKAGQDLLSANSINCIRLIAGKGFRVEGALTLADQADWKFVNVRRFLVFLEQSLTRGLQWAVFGSDVDAVWEVASRTVSTFLLQQWRQGALKGATQDLAFFIQRECGSTTQGGGAKGRLVFLLGAAVLKPGEFSLLRVTVQTG
jgi:uncharacterized protein